jgi:hypothetical protein
MQNSTITTTVHRAEVEVSADWADEALALAQRVNHKLRQPTAAAAPADGPEYEPQGLDEPSQGPARKRPA